VLAKISTLQVSDFETLTDYALPKLTHIHSDAELTTDQVKPLFKAQRKLRSLRVCINEHDVTELARVAAVRKLHTLSLWNEYETYDKRLAYTLDSGLTKLTSLELQGVVGKTAMSRLTKKGAFAGLRHLQLGMSNDALTLFAKMLPTRFPKLESLDGAFLGIRFNSKAVSLPKTLTKLRLHSGHDYDLTPMIKAKSAARLRHFSLKGSLTPEELEALIGRKCLADIEELVDNEALFEALTKLPGHALRVVDITLETLDDRALCCVVSLVRRITRVGGPSPVMS